MPATRNQPYLIASGALAILAGAGIAWLLAVDGGEPATFEPVAAPTLELDLAEPTGAAPPGAAASPEQSSPLVVDVQGAVARPGVYELQPGQRVADAVAAAGGYDAEVDLDAAAAALNLAAPLTDGAQVLVPRIGAAAVAEAPAAGAAAAPGGLVNLNSATPEELDALPGIGPVTVQKIVAARAERPFATLEELVERDVIHNGQLEQIRGLATVP